jgi:hypothetical protein
MGFYPGPTSGSFYWQYHALNELLVVIWGCLALLGYAALATYALRKKSPAIASACAILITVSTLFIFFRVNFLNY